MVEFWVSLNLYYSLVLSLFLLFLLSFSYIFALFLPSLAFFLSLSLSLMLVSGRVGQKLEAGVFRILSDFPVSKGRVQLHYQLLGGPRPLRDLVAFGDLLARSIFTFGRNDPAWAI